MTSVHEHDAVVEAIQKMLVEEAEPWVESGAAILELEEAGADLRPRRRSACALVVYVQNDAEVSLFPTAPGIDRAPIMNVFDTNPAALVDEVREYVRAVLAGQVELTLKKGSSAGRVRVWLSDGRTQTHDDNIVLGFLVGRGPRWDSFRPTPY